MAIRNYYVQPEHWPLKKFHLTYHSENFAFRIHAFREKAFRLVSLALELGVSDGPGFIGRVLERLNRRQPATLCELLKDFHQHQSITRWASRRNWFVHDLTKNELPELSSIQVVVFDVLRREGDDEDDWTVLQESEALDAEAERQGEEMEAALKSLKQFREGLSQQLESYIT